MSFKIFVLFFSILSLRAFSSVPAGIDWYQKGVESAFLQAKKENKSLFLYWGAVWCPPCNLIKRTIFTTPVFKQEIRNFIAIYLDGDGAEAQTWGEKLKTRGYPTMLILDPNGSEVMRLPIGVTADEYVRLMQESRAQNVSLKSRLDKAILGHASAKDWEILAGYSWEQDPDLILIDKKINTLDQLFQNAPVVDQKIKSKLFIQILLEYLSQEKVIPLPQLKNYQDYFLSMVKDESLIKLNLINFIEHSGKILDLLFFHKDAGQAQVIRSLRLTVENLLKNKEQNKLTLNQEVALYFPLVAIDTITQNKITDELFERINQVSRIASKKASGEFERQAVMSDVIDLLMNAKAYTLAKELSLKEIKISKSPFYFMSGLAEIEKKLGKNNESIEWAKKAWVTSTGVNTRFQWGVSYIVRLLDLKSDEADAIIEDSKAVMAAGLNNPEAFKGRNKARFEKLSNKLKEWGSAGARASHYTRMKLSLSQVCQKSSHHSECSAWLKTL